MVCIFPRPATQSSGFWHFSFWIQWWQTPGFRVPKIFSFCKILLWVRYFDLESRQNSQWLQWEFVGRAERPGSALRPPSTKHSQSCWMELKAQTTALNWDFHRAWDVWDLFWVIFNYKQCTPWCAAKITETDSLKDSRLSWQKMWHSLNKNYLYLQNRIWIKISLSPTKTITW